MQLNLADLAPRIHVTQADLDQFIDPASRARIGAAVSQLTGADAVVQQVNESATRVVYYVVAVAAGIGIAWWLGRR
jgi:hypothetical protein